MAREPEPSPPSNIPLEDDVRSQLERMLASDMFTRSQRLSAFLRFTVEQTLDGNGAGLKEQVLGSQLYAKNGVFDSAADPIVRVDARRLRDKLREYYAEFPEEPIVISLPKGSYVPVFEKKSAHAPPPPVALPAAPHVRDNARPHGLWIGSGIVVITLVTALLTWKFAQRDSPARLSRITSFPGQIGAPSLSPDGNFVAFSWKGPGEHGELDIWVKSTDNESLRQLTATPKFRETSAAWSPDGREIAFVRTGEGIFIVPQSGGLERKVSGSGTHVGWARDGKSILVRDQETSGPYSIYQIFLDGSGRRRLTQPAEGIGDWRFSGSPDGSSLAFIRYGRPGVGDLYVTSLTGGVPRRLTNWNGNLGGVDWTPDGRYLIYSAGTLWRISASVREPERGSPLPGLPPSAENPSISRRRDGMRLAFQTDNSETNFRIIDLESRLDRGVFQNVKPYAAATRLDYPGQFSPDGQRLAFVSARAKPKPELGSTIPELWVSAIDGTGLRQLASAPHLSAGTWSPDGSRIVYDAAIDGNSDLFVVNAAGGESKRLTSEPSIDALASWSHDGKWIYFTSSRGGSWSGPDIWRIPSDGGPAVRITFKGGLRPRESADGNYVYYADRPPSAVTGNSRLMRVPAAGGDETALFSGLTPLWWSVTETGVLFVTREADYDSIDRYSFTDQKVTRIGRLPFRGGPIGSQLNVSADGRWAILSRQLVEQDLMLLDGLK